MSAEDFYVGYEPHAPRPLARFVTRVVVALLLGACAIATLVALSQQRFDPGTFEYGVVRDFEGLLLERPVPMLVVEAPGRYDLERGTSSCLLLVAPGKFGASDLVAGFDGRSVALRGSLIHRDRQAMIEVDPDSIQALPASAPAVDGALLDLGRHTVEGEIVDSKCYLGVMKPGRRKTHRACAARCISGGVPPILRLETEDGRPVHLLLLGSEGEAIHQTVLDFVAEPIAVTGRIRRLGDQLVLWADPASIRRLSG